MNKTAKLIKQARIRAGLTQKEISDRLNLTTSMFISNLEHSKSPLPPKRVKMLSRLLKISAHQLIEAATEDYKRSMLEAMR